MANKMRVYEVAKELGVDSKVVINALRDMGLSVKNHMAALDESTCAALKDKFSTKQEQRSQARTPDEAFQERKPAQNPAKEVRHEAKPEPKAEARTAKLDVATQKPKQQSAHADGRTEQRTDQRTEQRQNVEAPQPKDLKQQLQKTAKGPARQEPKPVPGARRVTIQGPTPVRELAALIGVPIATVLRTLMSLGVLISINQNVPQDIAAKVAEKLGCVVTVKEPERTPEQVIAEELQSPDDPEKSVPRPPVVTVMGHVDHGKTSLLDAIRHTNVTAREAGGITQHIGASVVDHKGSRIIFLDTPGHEAFTAMRARGARVTDIAVLVVAADDGVMPQTVEAINHARAAGVPIIVAINKIDKPGAKPERVKQQLAELGLIPEEWGGDTVTVEVSAKTGQGIDDLLEMIVLVAEMQELKSDPTRRGRGYIIETQMDKGRGPVATAIIRSGVLKVGDVVITDTTWGRIRAMYDGRGRQVKKAGPSTPVELVGLEELPRAGDMFLVVDDEKMAKEIIERRKLERREQEMASAHRMTLEELLKKQQEPAHNELKLIIKSDVQGSLEAILQALGKLDGGEVKLEIIHSGVGPIIESDVMLAKASNARILGFNVRPDVNARNLAESDQIDIRTYRVIYDLVDDVQNMLKGLVKPKVEEVLLGRAEVRKTFHIPKIGTVAGCYVLDGKVTRQASVRLVRDGKVAYEGKLSSLKRFKDDVSEVSQGYECGIVLDRFQDIKPGDIIEAYVLREVRQA